MQPVVNRPVLRAHGEELEGSPVVRMCELAAGRNQRELRFAKGLRRGASFLQAAIQLVHQSRGRAIIDVPESGDHPAGAGPQESPGETDQALSRVRALAR